MRGVPAGTFGGFSVVYNPWFSAGDFLYSDNAPEKPVRQPSFCRHYSHDCYFEPVRIVFYQTHLCMAVEADCKTD